MMVKHKDLYISELSKTQKLKFFACILVCCVFLPFIIIPLVLCGIIDKIFGSHILEKFIDLQYNTLNSGFELNARLLPYMYGEKYEMKHGKGYHFIKPKSIDKNKPTLFLIAGTNGKVTDPYFKTLYDSDLYNIFGIGIPRNSNKNISHVLESMIDFRDKLVNEYGINTKNITITGHSIGGPIALRVGYELTKKYPEQKIKVLQLNSPDNLVIGATSFLKKGTSENGKHSILFPLYYTIFSIVNFFSDYSKINNRHLIPLIKKDKPKNLEMLFYNSKADLSLGYKSGKEIITNFTQEKFNLYNSLSEGQQKRIMKYETFSSDGPHQNITFITDENENDIRHLIFGEKCTGITRDFTQEKFNLYNSLSEGQQERIMKNETFSSDGPHQDITFITDENENDIRHFINDIRQFNEKFIGATGDDKPLQEGKYNDHTVNTHITDMLNFHQINKNNNGYTTRSE